VAAMNLTPLDTYIYPPEVVWKIDQGDKNAYIDLAMEYNSNPFITGVIIQHEYGIYGGHEGENILLFMEACKKPIVVTLHTVLPKPSPKMKDVTGKIIERANIIVVLTESSKLILERVYHQSINKVHVIPHGIHSTVFSDTTAAKRKLKLQKTTILTTFGLLSRGKGIEYVIRALPKIIKRHPSLIYLILGETHPVVRRSEGESYRNELSKLVTKLHLDNFVKFYDQYLSLPDLMEFLKATDIYISTSINPNQAVSGTLSYALGSGRAVISTEFAQSKEIITKDTGRLVPIMKPKAFTKALIELLGSKEDLMKMHKTAFQKTRPMLWSNVALKYSKLLKQYILPPVNLSHLAKMTDKYGLFQFAKLELPNKKFGYTLDDNARALVIFSRLASSPYNNKLASVYLRFIKKCQQADGTFINYIDHPDKKTAVQNLNEDLEDATARAMWALSEVLNNKNMPANLKKTAKSIFINGLPYAKQLLHIRSSALIIKSFVNAINACPEYSKELTASIRKNADFLVMEFDSNSDKSWRWFDNYLGYNNAVVPEALFIAGKAVGNKHYLNKGSEALTFLIEKTFSSNRYMPIGHSEWYKVGGERSYFDQQPEDPASMILALVTAYEITGNKKYKTLIDICFSWFLGNNSLQLSLYNPKNGGCYDGLHPDRVNLNQGAESQVSYLLSRLSVSKLYSNENPSNKKYIS
jgi:glycosyltransferase involved in cell wall biosynthesis